MSELDGMLDEAGELLEDTLDKLNCFNADDVKREVLMKQTKTVMCDISLETIHFISKVKNMISELRNENSQLKSKLIVSQQLVIKTQEEVMSCKSEQIEALQNAVKLSVETVETSVKKELQSYSSIVEKSLPKEHAISQETLCDVVKNVVQESDRSRNVILFGLPEEENENTNEKVSELFEEVGYKSKVDVSRIGRQKKDGAIRPVKVTFQNSLAVDHVLFAAKRLKNNEKYKRVFVSPDRSPEQRKVHRELVTEMKELASQNPNRKYFISKGQIQFSDAGVN